MKIDTCIKQSDVTQARSTLLQMLALARQKELSHEDLMRYESLFSEVAAHYICKWLDNKDVK